MSTHASNALSSYSNESYGGLFEPDVVLPSQYFSGDDDGLRGGERKLMAALLSDGIEAYVAQCTSTSSNLTSGKIDAREWVETCDENYVFSFDNVCECLGIDPAYLRLGLTRYVTTVQRQRIGGATPKRVWKKIRRPRKQ